MPSETQLAEIVSRAMQVVPAPGYYPQGWMDPGGVWHPPAPQRKRSCSIDPYAKASLTYV